MPEFVMPLRDKADLEEFLRLDEFTRDYVRAMFFTESGDSRDLTDLTFAGLAPETLERIKLDCDAFQAGYEHLIGDDVARAGRDFWYTRNGHGCGFWDGDWPEPAATELDEHAKGFGEFEPYVGDDGRIYFYASRPAPSPEDQ